MSTVLVIPDLQVPFHHKDALRFLEAVAELYEPDRIVQIGDLIDAHALSSYDHNPDGLSAGHELRKASKKLKAFSEVFPDVDIVLGNHDERIYRKAYEAGIPRNCVRDFGEIIDTPEGWRYHEEIEIDNVIYEHGHNFGNGSGAGAFKKAIDANMKSTVFGHFHSNAGIRYQANKQHQCFAMNVGCLMDGRSYAAEYGKRFVNKPILGCGVVEGGVPTFMPMVLGKNHRWDRRLFGEKM